MKIKLDLYRPYEMRAFANFLSEVAAGLDVEHKENGFDVKTAALPPAGTGGGLVGWRNAQDVSEPTEAGIVYGDPEPEPKQETTAEQAKPARTRRTKAQIEADAKAPEPAPLAISTGEERIDPAAEADAEQDAADEAAEHAVAEVEAAPLTHNDLRNAMGAYVKAFGMAETLEDGPGIMVAALGAPPAGADVWTASAVPVDKLGLAINAWLGAAAAGARFGH